MTTTEEILAVSFEEEEKTRELSRKQRNEIEFHSRVESVLGVIARKGSISREELTRLVFPSKGLKQPAKAAILRLQSECLILTEKKRIRNKVVQVFSLTEKAKKRIGKRIEVDHLKALPCVTCIYQDRCSLGNPVYNPLVCPWIKDAVLKEYSEARI